MGIRRFIIVGNHHSDTPLQCDFYSYTERILLSEKYYHQFEVINMISSIFRNSGVVNFLNQMDSNNISDPLRFSEKQVGDGFQNGEPWCNWENWENKANECCRLGMPISYFFNNEQNLPSFTQHD